MPRVISSQMLLDIFMLCLSWEWEEALRKHEEAAAAEQYAMRTGDLSNYKEPVSPLQRGYTTFDKVLRVLVHMGLITDSRRLSLYRNYVLQRLVEKNTKFITRADNLSEVRETSERNLLLRFVATKIPNGVKMLRDQPFLITETGRRVVQDLPMRYASIITKEQYLTVAERV